MSEQRFSLAVGERVHWDEMSTWQLGSYISFIHAHSYVHAVRLLGYTKAQDECKKGSCHPTTGDLLVGRSAQLTASSTCGLDGAQKYCILSYLESRRSRRSLLQGDYFRLSFMLGLDHVSIRLDLEALFQFSHLILTFKTFRPAAMLVERSADYGHTWKVLKYFAKDCAASFPNITSGQAQGVGDLVCDSKYSDIEPSTGGEVVLKVLDPSFEIENPYSPYIQDLVTLTNLRINFTKLHTLGDTLLGRREKESLDNYYYALYTMVVRGRCFCNGHASECGPVQKVRGDAFGPPGMTRLSTGGSTIEVTALCGAGVIQPGLTDQLEELGGRGGFDIN
ncbi:hypothetical protein GH733_013167 [Mirounga leonina]|nr:hypothetical protein GH733_013167 [Mirounga leonina]